MTPAVLGRLAETTTPQGVVGVARIPNPTLDDVIARRPRLAVLLAGVSDPGNAGTVIRTADAAGADGVLVTAGSTDVWSGKAIRSSAGSVFNLPVVTGLDVTAAVGALRSAGVRLLAATATGSADLDELLDAGELDAPTCWLLGSEAHGLPPQIEAAAEVTVRVPMRGRAESLNLAAAAAVCLFTSARAQRQHRPAGRDKSGSRAH